MDYCCSFISIYAMDAGYMYHIGYLLILEIFKLLVNIRNLNVHADFFNFLNF